MMITGWHIMAPGRHEHVVPALAHWAPARPAAASTAPRCYDAPVRPTPEQLESLSRFERATFKIADALSHPKLSPISAGWNSVVMGALIYSCGSRRFDIHGLDVMKQYGKKDSILLVANHRSFFDFFTITALLYWRTNVTKRIFFPVRATFFYDHPLGPAVNWAMSGMRMFPPVMRDKEKRAFNNYSVQRCIEELNRDDVGTVLGLHPEGTRNKGDDPYQLLPAQPGVGRVALGATRAHVIPVFALGMGQSIAGELKMNLGAPKDHPVDVWFGEPIDFSDLRPRANMITAQKRAADRCLDAIKALAEKQRRYAAVRDGREPDAEPAVEERNARPRRTHANGAVHGDAAAGDGG
jgi:1-acyl-sn-glycerol-3-phosphate acyltransferase